ncbi:MAG: hypothetical protein RKU31_42990 [Deltaproteobacteria bacterium]
MNPAEHSLGNQDRDASEVARTMKRGRSCVHETSSLEPWCSQIEELFMCFLP